MHPATHADLLFLFTYKDPVVLYVISYKRERVISKLGNLASNISRHNAMAYDTSDPAAKRRDLGASKSEI
jgi:hypothetical protein